MKNWKKLSAWLDNNLTFVLSAFLLAFIPLYPKLPLFDILPGYIVRVRVEDMLIAVAGLVWVVQLARKKVTWKSPLFRWIGAYTAVGFFSLLSAILLIHTVPPQLLHIGKSALHLFRYLEYFFLFVMMYSSLKTVRQAKIVIVTLAFSVLAVSLYGVGQKYFYWPVYSTMNREFSKGMRLYLTEHARVQSTFGGHYDLGAYLVVVLPLLLALSYKARSAWKRRIFGLIHLFGFWLLIVSASRAPFAAYAVAAGFVIICTSLEPPTWGKKVWLFLKRSLSFLLLAGIMMIAFGDDINERFRQVAQGYPQYESVLRVYDSVNAWRKDTQELVYYWLGLEKNPPKNGIAFDDSVLTPTDELPRPVDVYEDIPDVVTVTTQTPNGLVTSTIEKDRTWSANALKYGLSMGIRLDTLWPNALKGFLRNPLLGSGYATLNKEDEYHFLEADSTDNNFLRVLGETGLLGFVTFFGIIFVTLKSVSRHLFDKNPLTSALAVGLFAGSIGLLMNALYIDVYAASKVAFTYWALVGCVLAVFGLSWKTTKKRRIPS